MRLTVKMLDAMNTALAELLAGEGPQGYNAKEGQEVMVQAGKAQEWVLQEIERRRANQNDKSRPMVRPCVTG